MTLRLSIVVVNWNSRDLLDRCLSSLREQGYTTDSHVIVVDNNSTDQSAEMVQLSFPEVRLIQSGGNLGFAKGNNLALKEIQTKYVVYLNPDTEVIDRSFDLMLDFLENNQGVGLIGCKMINPDGNIQPLGLQWFPNPLTEFLTLLFITDYTIPILKRIIPYWDPTKSGYVNKLYGGCFTISTSLMKELGGFDERFFMYSEDVDLSRRVINNGFKLYYMSDAKIIHVGGGASKKANNNFSSLMKCESVSRLIFKHHGQIASCLYRLLFLLGTFFRLSASTIIWISNILAKRRYSDQDINSYYKMSKYYSMLLWGLGLKKVAPSN